jgi:hypothetical protein
MKPYLLMVQSRSFCSMCGPFCSMKISQEIRDVAEAEKGWQPNQRSLLNKERNLHLKLLTCRFIKPAGLINNKLILKLKKILQQIQNYDNF